VPGQHVRERTVLRGEGLPELLGERDEQGLGGCDVLTQTPCTLTQRETREELDGEIAEIVDGCTGPVIRLGRALAARPLPAQLGQQQLRVHRADQLS
jgi:hypothetical protein